jgi:hypothetical protein
MILKPWHYTKELTRLSQKEFISADSQINDTVSAEEVIELRVKEFISREISSDENLDVTIERD